MNLGRTPKGAYSSRGRSRHLLETPFSEPLLRTLLRTLFYCKTHSRPPSQNPSENPFSRTLPRTFSEPFLERCVAVRPLRRAPKNCQGWGFRQGQKKGFPQKGGSMTRAIFEKNPWKLLYKMRHSLVSLTFSWIPLWWKPLLWGSPKASRIFRTFRIFTPWNLLRPLCFGGERDLPHFPRIFPILGLNR